MEDELDLINIGAGIFNNAANLQLQKQKLAQTENLNNLNNLNKNLADQNSRNLTAKKEYLNASREDNETAINNLISDIRMYNVNATEWSSLDDKYKTESAAGIWDDLGIEYGENFTMREKFSDDVDTQLLYTQNLIEKQREVRDDLEKKKNAIFELQKDYMKIGTEEGYKGIKDMTDMISYMKADTLGEGGVSRFYDEAGNLSPLGTALTTPKKYASGQEYGFLPAVTNDMLKKAGLSTKPETIGKPVAEVESEELKLNLNANFAMLKQSLKKVKTKDPDSEWAADLGIEDFISSVSGASTLWDNQGQGVLLQADIENKLIDMMDYGTDHGIFTKESTRKKADEIRKKYQLDKNIKSNPALRTQVINLMFEEYAGNVEVPSVNKETGQESSIQLPKGKTEGGLLNEQFEKDKIYFKSGKPNNYGDTKESEVFYYLLQNWKPLYEAYSVKPQ